MGLPGHRRTSSHKRRRASHFALKPIALSVCTECKAPIAPHSACKNCGAYKGKKVLSTKRIAAKLVKKASAKKAAPMADDHAGHNHAPGEGHDDEKKPAPNAKKVAKAPKAAK